MTRVKSLSSEKIMLPAYTHHLASDRDKSMFIPDFSFEKNYLQDSVCNYHYVAFSQCSFLLIDITILKNCKEFTIFLHIHQMKSNYMNCFYYK